MNGINRNNMLNLFKTKKSLTRTEAFHILEEIEGQANPDLNKLEKLINYNEFMLTSLNTMLAIRKKYSVMTHELSPLEATMSTRQLFDAGNELWMRHYSIEAIATYLKHIEDNEIDNVDIFLERLTTLNDW